MLFAICQEIVDDDWQTLFNNVEKVNGTSKTKINPADIIELCMTNGSIMNTILNGTGITDALKNPWTFDSSLTHRMTFDYSQPTPANFSGNASRQKELNDIDARIAQSGTTINTSVIDLATFPQKVLLDFHSDVDGVLRCGFVGVRYRNLKHALCDDFLYVP